MLTESALLWTFGIISAICLMLYPIAFLALHSKYLDEKDADARFKRIYYFGNKNSARKD